LIAAFASPQSSPQSSPQASPQASPLRVEAAVATDAIAAFASSQSPPALALQSPASDSISSPAATSAVTPVLTESVSAVAVAEDEDDDLPRPGKVFAGPSIKSLMAAQFSSPVQRQATSGGSEDASIGDGSTGARVAANADPTAEVRSIWSDVLTRLDPSLSGMLRMARLARIEHDIAVVGFPPDGEMFAKRWAGNGKKELIAAAVSEAAGRSLGVVFEIDKAEAPASAHADHSGNPRSSTPDGTFAMTGGPSASSVAVQNADAASAPPPAVSSGGGLASASGASQRRRDNPPPPDAPAPPPVSAEAQMACEQDPMVRAAIVAFGARIIKIESAS
jgi:hypothetical protein